MQVMELGSKAMLADPGGAAIGLWQPGLHQGYGDTDEYAGVMDGSAFLPEGVPSTWQVYFGAIDVDASLAQAVELGGQIVDAAQDIPFGRLAGLTDPTGAYLKLVGVPS